jgi:hypothetical protein
VGHPGPVPRRTWLPIILDDHDPTERRMSECLWLQLFIHLLEVQCKYFLLLAFWGGGGAKLSLNCRHLKYKFYFSGVHPVALYYHTFQNMPAIATELLLLL